MYFWKNTLYNPLLTICMSLILESRKGKTRQKEFYVFIQKKTAVGLNGIMDASVGLVPVLLWLKDSAVLYLFSFFQGGGVFCSLSWL